MCAMGGRVGRLQSFLDEKEGQAQSMKLEADPTPTCFGALGVAVTWPPLCSFMSLRCIPRG